LNFEYAFQDVFIAGSDTASSIINWTMTEMLKEPRVLKKAQNEVRVIFNKKGKIDETFISELKYLKAVIKEVLR
jgi:cytochrome P450